MSNWRDFNINETVFIKLTDSGREALRKQHEDFYTQLPKSCYREYVPKKEDKEGWSKWQMWCLMESLGHLCVMGKEPPFETTIRLEEDEQL